MKIKRLQLFMLVCIVSVYTHGFGMPDDSVQEMIDDLRGIGPVSPSGTPGKESTIRELLAQGIKRNQVLRIKRNQVQRIKEKIRTKMKSPIGVVEQMLIYTLKDPEINADAELMEKNADNFGITPAEFNFLKTNFTLIKSLPTPVRPALEEELDIYADDQKDQKKEEKEQNPEDAAKKEAAEKATREAAHAAKYKALVASLLDAPRIGSMEGRDIYQLRVINQTDLRMPDECGYFALYNLACLLSAFESEGDAKESVRTLDARWNRDRLKSKLQEWKKSIAASGLGIPTSPDLALGQLAYLCGQGYEEKGFDPDLKNFADQNKLITIPQIYLISQPGYNEPLGLENVARIQEALERFRAQEYACLAFVMAQAGHFFGVCAVKVESRVYTFVVDSLNQTNLLSNQHETINLIVDSLRDSKPRFPFNYVKCLLPKLKTASDLFIRKKSMYEWMYGYNPLGEIAEAGPGQASLRHAGSLFDICLNPAFEKIFRENMPTLAGVYRPWFEKILTIQTERPPKETLKQSPREAAATLIRKISRVLEFFKPEVLGGEGRRLTPEVKRPDVVSSEG